MPKLRPLEQWICDTCGEIIESVEDGWFEWMEDGDNGAREFRIVHHSTASPLRETNPAGCYQHHGKAGHRDVHLRNVIGQGLPRLINFVHLGPYFGGDDHSTRFAIASEFAEILRRLLLPCYEEARDYQAAAEQDGYPFDLNEITIYTEDHLEGLIRQYE